jgi:hypothetical protein
MWSERGVGEDDLILGRLTDADQFARERLRRLLASSVGQNQPRRTTHRRPIRH